MSIPRLLAFSSLLFLATATLSAQPTHRVSKKPRVKAPAIELQGLWIHADDTLVLNIEDDSLLRVNFFTAGSNAGFYATAQIAGDSATARDIHLQPECAITFLIRKGRLIVRQQGRCRGAHLPAEAVYRRSRITYTYSAPTYRSPQPK